MLVLHAPERRACGGTRFLNSEARKNRLQLQLVWFWEQLADAWSSFVKPMRSDSGRGTLEKIEEIKLIQQLAVSGRGSL